jgi:hypothetical protein
MEYGETRLLEASRAVLDVDRRVRFTQAFVVGLLTAARVAPTASRTTAGSIAAGFVEAFEQAAKPFRTAVLEGAEQFDRVDAELEEEVTERLGAARRRDRLLFVTPVRVKSRSSSTRFAPALELFGGSIVA